MALSTLNASLQLLCNWTATIAQAPSNLNPIGNSSTIQELIALGTGSANNAPGGANELASFISSIAPSGATTLDLTTFTDILNVAGSTFGRVKAIVVQLLSTTNDAVNGTTASYVTVGDNGSANDFISSTTGEGWLGSSLSSLVIPNGGFHAFGVGNATGVLVSGTQKLVKIANGDAATTAKVQTTFIGGAT